MNSLLIWPVAVPLAAALAALLSPRRAALVGIAAGVATLAVVTFLTWRIAEEGPLIHALGGWEPGLGIALRADALAASLLVMSALVVLGAGIYASGYFRDAATQARFWPLWLLLQTALNALFLAAGVIQQRAGHDRIAELGGTARTLPVTTFALALAGIALIGLPPSGTFLAKWQLLSTAFATGQWLWVPVVGAGSLLAAGLCVSCPRTRLRPR